jgi:hypothetical protein
MDLDENNRDIDQITENRHNCTIYPTLDNTQTKEHGVVGYATSDKFRKKLICKFDRKRPSNRGCRFN